MGGHKFMIKKRIGRKVYRTDKSKYIGTNTKGDFGDPNGFEEQMFKKGDGDFFLVVQGGENSQYSDTDILPLELDDAKEWILRVCGEDVLNEVVTEKDEEAAKPKKKTKKSTKKSKKKNKK